MQVVGNQWTEQTENQQKEQIKLENMMNFKYRNMNVDLMVGWTWNIEYRLQKSDGYQFQNRVDLIEENNRQ